MVTKTVLYSCRAVFRTSRELQYLKKQLLAYGCGLFSESLLIHAQSWLNTCVWLELTCKIYVPIWCSFVVALNNSSKFMYKCEIDSRAMGSQFLLHCFPSFRTMRFESSLVTVNFIWYVHEFYLQNFFHIWVWVYWTELCAVTNGLKYKRWGPLMSNVQWESSSYNIHQKTNKLK